MPISNSLITNNIDPGSDCDAWRIVRTSAFFKDQFRLDFAEKEIMASYKLALDCLYEAMKNSLPERTHVFIQVLRSGDYTIPFLFACRHLLELSLKACLESNDGRTRTGHSIGQLWHDVKALEEFNSTQYEDLISLCVMLDDDGCHLRYAKKKDGSEYQNKPYFIDYEATYRSASDLYSELVRICESKSTQKTAYKNSEESAS